MKSQAQLIEQRFENDPGVMPNTFKKLFYSGHLDVYQFFDNATSILGNSDSKKQLSKIDSRPSPSNNLFEMTIISLFL